LQDQEGKRGEGDEKAPHSKKEVGTIAPEGEGKRTENGFFIKYFV